ncbi:hypothetical protein DFH29DRAFT_1079402 [Suillus ampliporus]|nr:hypothetical protein DFH29DRAFT_1079402 [Suillus ampliporus]
MSLSRCRPGARSIGILCSAKYIIFLPGTRIDSAPAPVSAMSRIPVNFLCNIAVISSQVIIMAFAYGFLGAVLYYDHLAPPDQVGNLWRQYPGELTVVVTSIATVLSVVTATLCTISIREALRHRMSRPISLGEISAGVALAKGSVVLRPEYLRLSILTLFVFGVLRLLTAGWTTLLTPSYFQWPIQMNGSELDITGSAFSSLLYEAFQAQGVRDIRDNAFEVLYIDGVLSGVATAGNTYGLPGTFNFNGAKYNISTQGIVPTIEDYAGSDGVPNAANGTRLGFSGGRVIVNTRTITGKHTSVSIPEGFSRNYSMTQQGLTANISCRAMDSSQTQYVWETNNYDDIYSNSAASNDTIAGLRVWSTTANCGTNTLTTQQYVTVVNADGTSSPSGSGFLPSIVCPGLTNMNQTYTSFAILSQGFDKYNFLNATVCEVVPFLTTVRADYSNGLISSVVTSSTAFQPENANLLSFITGISRFHSLNAQGLRTNAIGDSLYSIYSSTSNTSIGNSLGTQTQIYQELEGYWRGVVEFSATFLRSGFMVVGSFPDNVIPDNLSSPVNGTMYISTVGWTKRSPTYLLAILPITIITILTFACTLYSIVQTWKDRQTGRHRTTFDVSNTLHLIMASAVGDLSPKPFDAFGINYNECVQVRLEEPKEEDGVKKKLIQVYPPVASTKEVV